MRVFGLMVAKNEAHRYLESSVAWLRDITDAVFVYDDDSTDHSASLAADVGATVARSTGPGLLADESAFREAAWKGLGVVLQPTTDDWVMSVDADEFPVTALRSGERSALRALVDYACSKGFESVEFSVAEIFDEHNGVLQRRVDGFWGGITAVRLSRWTTDSQFPFGALGCGSVPKANYPALRVDPSDMEILHVGYMHRDDRQAKWDRYRNRGGHASAHVTSIIKPPTLEPWAGIVPPIWRAKERT